MKRMEWFLVILPLFLTWGLDRISKVWAETLNTTIMVGPGGFALHHNHGAMLGLFSHLPAVLRIVSFSTGGAFLLFTFGILQYLLPIKSMTLRMGMSILIGGILGNVTDRILTGYVVDFIFFKISWPVFNVADALQWVGYAMISWALIREGDLLWPADNNRKMKWINLKFQLRYSFFLVGVGAGFSCIAGVYSYTFLRVTIMDLVGNNPALLNQYLIPFFFNFILVSAFFCIMLFLLGHVLSGKIAGPLYAFEKFLDDLVSGRPRRLKLRTGDELRHLESLAERLSNEMLKNHSPAILDKNENLAAQAEADAEAAAATATTKDEVQMTLPKAASE